MGIEENKEVVKEFVERFGNGDNSVVDELTTEDWVSHLIIGKGIKLDKNVIKQTNVSGHVGFADYSMTIDDMIAEGDKVMVLCTRRGTNTGEFGNIPPTGKEVQISRFTLYRLENGKIAETWNMDDMLGQYQQLGVLPPTAEFVQAYKDSLK